MEYLRQLKARKLQPDNACKINEFNTEFKRYYVTRGYEEVFATCLKMYKESWQLLRRIANRLIDNLAKQE